MEFTPPPQPLFTIKNHSIRLIDILSEYDPDKWEKATSKYRKPRYQRYPRGKSKEDIEWCKELVKTVLFQGIIGGIVMSKHNKIVISDGVPYNEEWYNIEDGQTRLDALLRFRNDEFKTEYGDYQYVKDTFDNYHISVIIAEKADQRTSEDVYFKELVTNFDKLQRSKPLSNADRYYAHIQEYRIIDDSKQIIYAGSPIVNYTIELVEKYKKSFSTIFGLKMISGEDGWMRKKIQEIVGLISGMIWGPEYLNGKFMNHMPILFEEITDEQKSTCDEYIQQIFKVAENAFGVLPKIKGEHSSSYFTIANLSSLIVLDCCNNQHKEDDAFQMRWLSLLNTYRKKKKDGEYDNNFKEWLIENVYFNLNAGHQRNCMAVDIEARLKAVNEWYDTTIKLSN